MKINIVLIMLLGTILFSCSSNKNVISDIKNEPTMTVSKKSTLIGKWKLIELNGRAIDNENFYIQFYDDNHFSSFAGCNGMNGEYDIKNGFKIQFSKVMSTLMACQDMETEQQLAKVFEIADNFNLNTNSLSLNKAKIAPLARFELMK